MTIKTIIFTHERELAAECELPFVVRAGDVLILPKAHADSQVFYSSYDVDAQTQIVILAEQEDLELI